MSIIRVAQSAVLSRWDVKHILARQWMRPDSEMVHFGAIATRRREVNQGNIRYGSVHLDGRISARSTGVVIQGATFVAHPQDVVFSRIDVRNGAIGVVPSDHGPLAFTNEFPIYDVSKTGRILPEFVSLLCRTEVFRSQVQALVVGHSGRKRVSAELFEKLLIPVPDIAEQRAIVERHATHLSHAMELRSRAAVVLGQAIDRITEILALRSPDVLPIRGPFVVSSHRTNQWSVFAGVSAVRGVSNELQSCYPIRSLGNPDLAIVSYGIQKSPRNRPSANGRPYLRVANVQDGYLDLREVKYIDVPDSQMSMYRLKAGDILLCEGNSAELVGRPAIWNDEIPDCVHQNHVLRVRTNSEYLLPQYLLAFMQTAPSRGHFRRRAKNTTNLSTINSADVRDLLLPIPPLDDQRNVAETWANAQLDARNLRAQAEEMEGRAHVETAARIAGS